MPRNPFDSTIRVLHGLRRGLERKRRTGGLSREEDARLQIIKDGIDRLELAEWHWMREQQQTRYPAAPLHAAAFSA